jgi:hypothetical protein
MPETKKIGFIGLPMARQCHRQTCMGRAPAEGSAIGNLAVDSPRKVPGYMGSAAGH